MRLAMLVLIVGCAIWVGSDSQAKHLISVETTLAKHTILTTTCPPSNGSSFCHAMARLLYP